MDAIVAAHTAVGPDAPSAQSLETARFADLSLPITDVEQELPPHESRIPLVHTESGHHGDAVTVDHNSLDTLTSQAKALEDHGWKGGLIGTGWVDRTRSPSPPPLRPGRRHSSRSSQSGRGTGNWLTSPPPSLLSTI